ncbi:hypothetical protein [Dictyobacter formicarum]|uniref:Uncharacterized protein n=1 Tax=Dictyobacter formicarum TaxID=2778368 RepID=A0ABQ3VHC1_9CHLR|nr:hypothetical protein [Dictyobacter formicarum]GHO85043.1 hypothetical protein KSZ_30490 [Dictyobacter formicarum]
MLRYTVGDFPVVRSLLFWSQYAHFGFTRFLLGAQESSYDFYTSNGYVPELYFTVEISVEPERFEAYLIQELHHYPLIWKQHDQYGSHAIIKTPFPDLELLHRVERTLPTCKAQYLFFKDVSVKGETMEASQSSIAW